MDKTMANICQFKEKLCKNLAKITKAKKLTFCVTIEWMHGAKVGQGMRKAAANCAGHVQNNVNAAAASCRDLLP